MGHQRIRKPTGFKGGNLGKIWGIVSLKRFVSLFFFVSFLMYATNTPAFAEVDPAVLSEIFSKLAGENVSIPKASTGSTSTGVLITPSVEADHFIIFSNTTGKVGELMNIMVKALKKDGTVASGYKGTVFINVEKDYAATVPYMDGYTFTSSDHGVKSFPKGLSFSKPGTFTVSVSDLDRSSLVGNISVTITEAKTVITEKPVVLDKPLVPEPAAEKVIGFKIVKVETGDKKATFTFRVSNETSNIRKFEFLYADAEGKSDKMLTYEKERIKNANGEYVWYIPNLSLSKYTISIAGVGADGESISGVISQPFEADLSLSSAGKCVIPNVSGLRVLSKRDTSVLYWDSIPEAINYKVYKKNNRGEYVLVQETKNDSYTIHVSDGSVKYEEFSVKAVCSDGTESIKFSPSTNIRTGPSGLILLGLISAAIAWGVVRKRKKIFGKL